MEIFSRRGRLVQLEISRRQIKCDAEGTVEALAVPGEHQRLDGDVAQSAPAIIQADAIHLQVGRDVGEDDVHAVGRPEQLLVGHPEKAADSGEHIQIEAELIDAGAVRRRHRVGGVGNGVKAEVQAGGRQRGRLYALDPVYVVARVLGEGGVREDDHDGDTKRQQTD